MPKEERISLREYADLCRTSHQTVSAAIKNGSIVDGYDAKAKKIIKSVADLEWGVEFMRKRAEKKAEESGFDYSSQFTDNNEERIELNENTNAIELERLELYYKVVERKLKIEKEEGILVNKQQVYNQLFGFARNLRTKIKALPDTIIDRLVTLNRDEAKLYLEEELHNILESLSNDVDSFNSGDAGWVEAGAEDFGE